MATNLQIITRVRDMLDEATARQWTDSQLRTWMNDGANEIARVTRVLETSTDVSVTAGSATAAIPAACLEIQHCYWKNTGETRLTPLVAHYYEAMDPIWGTYDTAVTGDPVAFAPRGISPNLTVHLYPIPSQAGTLRVFYANLPTAIALDTTADSSTSSIPEGWVDLLVSYVEFRALRKDRDPRWQEAKALFNEALEQLAEYSVMSIAREMVHDPMVGGMPRWLVDPDWY